MHRDEPVGHLQRAVFPAIGGVERDRLAELFEQRVGFHIGVVVHRLVARRRHHEADDAFLVAEILHRLIGGFRIVERQVKHRDQPRLDREDALAEPAVIGAAQRHLDLDLRMQAEKQHRGREQAGVIDAERIHPLDGHGDVAVPAVLRHFLQPAQIGAGDAATEILIADRCVDHGGPAGALSGIHHVVADHRALDVLENFLVGFVLVVVGVDVDDQKILVIARPRLLRRVLKVLRGRVIVEVKLADFVRSRVHDLLLLQATT